VCDNTSTSVVKPLVLDLHHSMNLDAVRLERKRNLEKNWRENITPEESIHKRTAPPYMYVVVSKVRPER